MENQTNPLLKYQRAPKLLIDLPSKGRFYKKGTLERHEELEVYSITASDEIRLKTPDSLYTGKAVVDVISRCIPSIKDATEMPVMDLDYVLSAIRIASYGDVLPITGTCPECKNDDEFSVELQKIMDHYASVEFNETIEVDDLVFHLRPISYKELTHVQKETTYLQRQVLLNLENIQDEKEREKLLDSIYERLSVLNEDTVTSVVTKIVSPDGEETNLKTIKEFLKNSEPKYYKAVLNGYQKNSDSFAAPKVSVECSKCSEQYKIAPHLDSANFFV